MSMYRFGDDYGLSYSPLDALDNPKEDGWDKVESVEIDGTVFINVDSNNHWYKLFGTPERAARTVIDGCGLDCVSCLLPTDCPCHDSFGADDADYDALLEWLRGEDEVINEPDTIRNELMDSGLLRGDA